MAHCRVSGLLEQTAAADALQRPLVPRSRFRARLNGSVGHPIGGFMAKFPERIRPQGRVPNLVNFTT